MSTFGQRLKSEREKKGYNQKEFADVIGVTPTRLNYWEKDKREPDFLFIRKIIDALECDADYLLGTKYSDDQIELSSREKEMVLAYRAKPDLQNAVDILLGIE